MRVIIWESCENIKRNFDVQNFARHSIDKKMFLLSFVPCFEVASFAELQVYA